MRRADSLFARLFGVFLAAILLAHALAFVWFSHYGRRLHRRRWRSTKPCARHRRGRTFAAR